MRRFPRSGVRLATALPWPADPEHADLKVDAPARGADGLEPAGSSTPFRAVFEHAPIGMAVLDDQGLFIEGNDALIRLLGYELDELLTLDYACISHPEEIDSDRRAAQRLIAGHAEVHAAERRYRHADGRDVWTLLSMTVIRTAAAQGARFLIQLVDISERKEMELRLQHLADHDPLTGLLNRRRFESELAAHLARSRRYGAKGALMILDVDRLKHVNDTYGHRAGDELITEVARVLGASLRSTDLVARLGGDEFGVLLPESVSTDEAAVVARKLSMAVRAIALTVADSTISIGISIGVAMLDGEHVPSAEASLIAADQAMYDAKRRAGGRHRFGARQRTGRAPTPAERLGRPALLADVD